MLRRFWRQAILVLLLIGYLTNYIRAQSTGTTFSFEHLTVDDGLSYSTVHDLLQDDLGMIWVGTRFGLNRYDGYTFKVYLPDPEDPHSIKSQSILCLETIERATFGLVT